MKHLIAKNAPLFVAVRRLLTLRRSQRRGKARSVLKQCSHYAFQFSNPGFWLDNCCRHSISKHWGGKQPRIAGFCLIVINCQLMLKSLLGWGCFAGEKAIKVSMFCKFSIDKNGCQTKDISNQINNKQLFTCSGPLLKSLMKSCRSRMLRQHIVRLARFGLESQQFKNKQYVCKALCRQKSVWTTHTYQKEILKLCKYWFENFRRVLSIMTLCNQEPQQRLL